MTETETGTTGFGAPPLRRLRYFHGQMLSARDFQREQEYFREKLRLRLRSLLGYGVVCGLFVEPPWRGDDHRDAAGDAPEPGEETAAGDDEAAEEEVSEDDAGDEQDAEGLDASGRHRHRARVRITPGLGVDCDGNEIVVRDGTVVDLWKALPPDERDTGTVWVGVRYAERPVEPTRAVYNDGCAESSDCEFGWTEECYTVRVTGHEPPQDERCDTACAPGRHRTLWLARIDDVDLRRPVREDQIHMNVRRPFGRHVPTVITGVNWIHGHTYTVDEARALLGTHDEAGGLVVRFSGDVRVDTLLPGVVEIQVIEGGAGRNASTWYMGGTFAEPDRDEEFTRGFRYRQTTKEVLQDGDRVLISVRGAFILDRCRRPVDGTHVGGRVPTIDPAEDDGSRGRDVPPSGVGPWTSGTGAGGDVFESWFFVRES
ncbi:hypothetical protein Skr01_69450 [Sphaerisporangium krabiense]|uniref:Uncharacterized protein n=1 Tax=Sphaerisporangium krabiense TaxID=763782 RepID=A0A7W9DRC3_9ACTN|nr:hypothetical protein [Sphaerisporangium krabiense]MBB5628401.1 hypothetical protein [Sphaerisporangium krabiense]GII66860.1 hypothetical protein Skr01_69450 [Sphaerisporangium krabiense]